MIPEVNSTCAFTFTAKFAALDGVYRIRAETTFVDAFASNIDFVTNLYLPAGLGQGDFNTDYTNYLKDRVAVLESVGSPTVIYYVPESVFLTVPDPTIKEFVPLMLAVDLGVHRNTQEIYPLLDQINDLITASLGTSNSLRVLTNTQRKVYLTDTQYDVLDASRQANIKALMPLSLQLKQEQEKTVFLAAKVAAYEDLIKKMSGNQ